MSALKRHRSSSPAEEERELFESAPKRHRPNRTTPILHLSDELFLRIASHLQIRDLAAFQRVSHRCSRIAVDGQIWKALYYHRFVRPRASRIPGLLLRGQLGDYASRQSIWLEDEGIAREVGTNWKAQYRLRHNWGKGACRIREIDMAGTEEEQHDASDSLVTLFEGIVFTASSTRGLRAWRLRNDNLIAQTSLYSNTIPFSRAGAPTALAVDEESGGKTSLVNVTVGFSNGAFAMYQLDMSQPEQTSTFRRRYTHAPLSSDKITAMASLGPYLSVMAGQVWDIYDFSATSGGAAQEAKSNYHEDVETDDDDYDSSSNNTSSSILRNSPSSECRTRMIHSRNTPHDAPTTTTPKLLTSLRSSTAWPPITLSLRRSVNGTLLASIVYASPLYTSGWSVGMQELRFTTTSSTATLTESRIASSVPTGFVGGGGEGAGGGVAGIAPPSTTGHSDGSQLYDPPLAQPTCLSYCHPYLLTAHADNTLTLHLIHSSTSSLHISPGQRLWGHTSAVTGVLVDARGKAVSIGRSAEEMRVWELEGRRNAASVLVQRGKQRHSEGREGRLGGFDEEKVVVLLGGEERKHIGVWDFSR